MRLQMLPFLFVVLLNFWLESNAPDNGMQAISLRIVEVVPSGSISVELTNSSSKPVRIWNESNSWGAARWRILLIRDGRLEAFFQNPDQDFTRNIPTFKEIPSRGHITNRLDLNGGNWRGVSGKTVQFSPGDRVVVVYDVPFTIEASKMDVWYGVVAALKSV
jgi:hypothetical protein